MINYDSATNDVRFGVLKMYAQRIFHFLRIISRHIFCSPLKNSKISENNANVEKGFYYYDIPI